MTMTDEQIIKALERCYQHRACCYCNSLEECGSTKDLTTSALDLINRQKTEIDILIRKKETLRDEVAEQQAEIERLREENTALDGANVLLTVTLQNARAEAIKEFAERLKDQAYINNYCNLVINTESIDNLVKEMTEYKNDFKEEIIMGDCMTFPATFEEFAEEYKIVDSKEVYTNGTELIPIFRVKQWLEHKQNDLKE